MEVYVSYLRKAVVDIKFTFSINAIILESLRNAHVILLNLHFTIKCNEALWVEVPRGSTFLSIFTMWIRNSSVSVFEKQR